MIYSPGDIVTVVINHGEESQTLLDVELEERFETPKGVVWRSVFVDGLGGINVFENMIQGFDL